MGCFSYKLVQNSSHIFICVVWQSILYVSYMAEESKATQWLYFYKWSHYTVNPYNFKVIIRSTSMTTTASTTFQNLDKNSTCFLTKLCQNRRVLSSLCYEWRNRFREVKYLAQGLWLINDRASWWNDEIKLSDFKANAFSILFHCKQSWRRGALLSMAVRKTVPNEKERNGWKRDKAYSLTMWWYK